MQAAVSMRYKFLLTTAYVSPTFKSISLIKAEERRKFVIAILSKAARNDGMSPDFFASIKTPIVPVTWKPSAKANFRAFKSSIINNGLFDSAANAMALASPASTDTPI